MLFGWVLQKIVRHGDLTVIDADGKELRVGDGTGHPVTMRLHHKSLHHKLALNPYLHLGEAYMDGTLTVDEPAGIYDLLDILLSNIGTGWVHPLASLLGTLRRARRRIDQYNPIGKAQANVAHHYDLDGGIYDLFLDEDKQYSCAYFERPGQSLEEAQLAKKRHIAAKLKIEPGMRVLDIGCGWGGLGLYLAEETGAKVLGVTLSKEQHRVALRRAAERGLADRAKFGLMDYRVLDDQFDRIVSVGMFEHVGVTHYTEYFQNVRNLLKPDGVALIHTIGRLDVPGSTNPWIKKYIFPGGYIPALSEVAPVLEKEGLLLGDLEVLRLHYAETLREWRRRFMAKRDFAARIYDERFCRMWEFYLAGSETSFRHEGMVVFQFQITKEIGALPITRDYMLDWERAHRDDVPPRQTAIGAD